KTGKQYTVGELMKASLIVSGNDATALLARQLYGSENEFAKQMNKKAAEIGLKTAVFYNSTGLPVYPKDIQNKMSIRDLAKLSQYILNNYPEILDITSIKEIKDPNSDKIFENTNPLLGTIEGVDGLKTGNTRKAGSCLVWTMRTSGDLPGRLLGVHLGFKKGEIRDRVLTQYANFVKDNYSVNSWVSKDRPIYLYVKDAPNKFIPIYPQDEFNDRAFNDYDLQISLNEGLSLPFKAGDVIGSIALTHNGITHFSTGLIIKNNFGKKKFC
ncbi:MAG: serine hydrolase, partial [Peptoniphilus sp.]|nr:serine hydrolase [Peptoniphilus sp.]